MFKIPVVKIVGAGASLGSGWGSPTECHKPRESLEARFICSAEQASGSDGRRGTFGELGSRERRPVLGCVRRVAVWLLLEPSLMESLLPLFGQSVPFRDGGSCDGACHPGAHKLSEIIQKCSV